MPYGWRKIEEKLLDSAVGVTGRDTLKIGAILFENMLAIYGFSVFPDTKIDLLFCGIDLLWQINAKNLGVVNFSITTPNDELSKNIDPNVCVSSKRMQASKTLSNMGIFVCISMYPVLLFITDTEIELLKENVYNDYEKDSTYVTYKDGTKKILTLWCQIEEESMKSPYGTPNEKGNELIDIETIKSITINGKTFDIK